MLPKPLAFILLACLLASVASGSSSGSGNGTNSNDMGACRSALQEYGEVMGHLQSCVVVSILPSNICQACLVPYLAVKREYEHLDSVNFSETETCKQLYVNSAHFLQQDSYMFTHTYEAAVNASSPFVRAHCETCYAGDELTMYSDLRPEIEAYIEEYVAVKACFDKWAYVVDNTANPVCAHCRDVFQKSQDQFHTDIMHNRSDYLDFTKVCLDVADRYQELNHLYQKYDCNDNVHSYVDMGVEFGFGIAFLVAVIMLYASAYSEIRMREDTRNKNAVYIVSQLSENMKKIRERVTSDSSSERGDPMEESLYTLDDSCPYPSNRPTFVGSQILFDPLA